jgi:flagellar basal body-associated protein FliL
MNQLKKIKNMGGNKKEISIITIIVLLIIGGFLYYYFYIYKNNGNNKQTSIPNDLPIINEIIRKYDYGERPEDATPKFFGLHE